MATKLTRRSFHRPKLSLVCLAGRRIVVGRKAQDGVDVVIDDGSVSGTHCELNIGASLPGHLVP